MRLRQYSSGKSAADGEKSVCQYPVPRHAVARTHLMMKAMSMHSVSSASPCGRPHAPDDEGNQHALRGHQHALVMHHEPQQADRVRVDHFAMADDTAARGEGTREHGPKRHVVEERATAAHLMRDAITMQSAFNQHALDAREPPPCTASPSAITMQSVFNQHAIDAREPPTRTASPSAPLRAFLSHLGMSVSLESLRIRS